MTDTAALLAEIEAYCRHHRISEKTFGQRAVRNWKLVPRLREPRKNGEPGRVWPETANEIRAFIAKQHSEAA